MRFFNTYLEKEDSEWEPGKKLLVKQGENQDMVLGRMDWRVMLNAVERYIQIVCY